MTDMTPICNTIIQEELAYSQHEINFELISLPSTWHREYLDNIYSIFSVARGENKSMIIQKCMDIDTERNEAAFSVFRVKKKDWKLSYPSIIFKNCLMNSTKQIYVKD